MTTMEEVRADMAARLEHAKSVQIADEALRAGAPRRGFGSIMLERIRDRLGLNGWVAATNS